jgi:acetyl-CoA C-acetyltransferase
MAEQSDPVVIVGAARTPMGGMLGDFASVPATQLGGVAIKAALERSKVDPADVGEVLMGCCLMAGLKQAPARQAAHFAGVPWEAGATTLTKMCGSAMKTTMLGHDNLIAGSHDVVITGGMESMTNAPYLVLKGRTGYRLGHGDKLMDHMFYDGLEDAYEEGRSMGTFAEETAERYQFTREAQDAFAAESVKRSQRASNDGTFEAEIAPVTIKDRKGEKVIGKDQSPFQVNVDKIPTLRPAFRKDGTVTAATSSSIADGAAALVLMRRSTAEKKGITPLAVIHAHTTHSQAPNLFTTAPIGALRKLLEKTGWKNTDVDLWEVNEAFAVVTMAAMRDIGIPHDKVNVNGGACALGHPVGASGARIVVTLLHALEKHGLKKGVASLCIGGGEATAMAVERVA